MKKNLLLLLVALCSIGNVFAQQYQANKNFRPENLRSSTAGGDILLGYCNPNSIETGVGSSAVGDLGAVVYFDKNTFGAYAGSKINAIRVGFADNVTNLSIFIKSTLTGNDLYTQTVGNKASGWHTIELTTPFAFPTEGFYIGYKARGGFAMGFSGTTDANACWLWEGGNEWFNYSNSEWGSLCIMAVIDPATYNKNDVGMASVEKIHTQTNKVFTVSASARNNMASTLTSLGIGYKVNNGASVKKTINCNIAPGTTGWFSFEMPSISEVGAHSLSVTIESINGLQDDNPNNNTATGSLIVYNYSFPKKIVVEEGTGTWCGWCPRGAVGLAKMKEKYPNNFIGIAVHDGDEMTVNEYDRELGITGFPGSKINRKREIDPNFSTLDYYYQQEISIPAMEKVDLNASLNNNTINVRSNLTFAYNSSSINCRIAYVLIENNVTGYKQSNFYAGGGNGTMGGWEKFPSQADVAFQDVARGIYSGFNGISGSVPASVKEGVAIEHTYSITLPNTIKNKNELELVALLIDAVTGEILNADKVLLEAAATIAVSSVSLNKTTLSLNVKETDQLTAAVLPNNATNKDVSWSSSNTSVATVSATGLVTAKQAGSATITATTEDGNKKATCAVTVTDPIPVPDEINADENEPVGATGQGAISLSLNIPTNAPFSGDFTLTLPEGFSLNPDLTSLSIELREDYILTITPLKNNKWMLNIDSKGLRSSNNSSYQKIADLIYDVDEQVRKGTYPVVISDLEFSFGASTLSKDVIEISVTVDRPDTGIQDMKLTNLYYLDGNLYLDTSAKELVSIYSVSGTLLHQFEKQTGKAIYSLGSMLPRILIVGGDSGWNKKVVVY